MTGFDLLTNYVEDPEALIRRTTTILKKVPALKSEDNHIRWSLTPEFEAMAKRTLYEFSACDTLVLSIAFGTCISWAQASSKHSWAWAYGISSYSYILSYVMLIIYMHMLVTMCDQCKRWLWGYKNTLDTSRMVNGTMLYSWHGPILLLSLGLL